MRKIYLQILGLLIVCFAVIIAIVYYQGQKLKKNVATQEISNTMKLIDFEIDKFYKSVETAISISGSYAESGLFLQRSLDNVNAKFIPLLAETPAVHSIEITRENGVEYFLGRHAKGWNSKVYENDTNNLCKYLIYNTGINLIYETDTVINKRFINSKEYEYLSENLNENEILWSKPGNMAGNRNLGFFGSKYVRVKNRDIEYTLSFNISYKSIYTLLDSLNFMKNGMTIVFTPDKKVFQKEQLNTELGVSDYKVHLAELNEIESQVIFQAINNWEPDTAEPFTIKKIVVDKENWWVGYTNENQQAILTVIIPESDFSFVMEGRNRAILVILLIVLAFLIAGFFIMKSILSNKINAVPIVEDLTNDAIYKLIEQGESTTQEFKSTVRMNLKKGQAGKEIEIAWLKSVVGFMNTNGGRIIIGVDDDGQVLGIEADRFPNDDKCRLHLQNLLKQHIGLEFANYVRFKLYKLNDKTIVIIQCQPTDNPVFLKHGDKEQFYIRSGPASVELSVSKALKYINDRKKKE